MPRLRAFVFAVVGLALSAHADTPTPSVFPLYNLSVLLPLPRNEIQEAPGLDAAGCARPLLEKELFAGLPRLTPTRAGLDARYAQVRVVGWRFDLKDEELRVVAQPLFYSSPVGRPGKTIKGDDAAVHLFYRMSRARLMEIQRELANAFADLPSDKLGVHPRLGQDEAARPLLRKLLCATAESPLFKVTFMNVRGNRFIWNFGGFLVDENPRGERVRLQDVTVANTNQTFLDEGDSDMSVQQVTRFSGSLNGNVIPRPVKGDHMLALFDAGARLPSVEVPEMRLTIDRIENPRLNNPSTVDCLSCHATESARIFAENVHKSPASAEAYALPRGYGLDASISQSALRNTANFRAFGYLDTDACINRRVLNETIEMQREAALLERLARRS